jgi:hypothetical protein
LALPQDWGRDGEAREGALSNLIPYNDRMGSGDPADGRPFLAFPTGTDCAASGRRVPNAGMPLEG